VAPTSARPSAERNLFFFFSRWGERQRERGLSFFVLSLSVSLSLSLSFFLFHLLFLPGVKELGVHGLAPDVDRLPAALAFFFVRKREKKRERARESEN